MNDCEKCLYTGCTKRANGVKCRYFKDKKKTVENIKDEINKKSKRDIRDKQESKETNSNFAVI